MIPDATTRFSSRVADYIRYRPSYPMEVIALLGRECGLSESSVVADVGSGTGILSGLILRTGCEVYGIEPNADMRRAGEELLAGHPRFHSIEARAEATTLGAASVDIITAAQAFHWFDSAACRVEFSRVLRQGGWVVLIWNERLASGTPFLVGYEQLLKMYAPEYEKVDHRRIETGDITAFYGHSKWRRVTYPNQQIFDHDGVRGRLLSCSYAPAPETPEHSPMLADLRALFDGCQRDGRVEFLYDTTVYYGSFE